MKIERLLPHLVSGLFARLSRPCWDAHLILDPSDREGGGLVVVYSDRTEAFCPTAHDLLRDDWCAPDNDFFEWETAKARLLVGVRITHLDWPADSYIQASAGSLVYHYRAPDRCYRQSEGIGPVELADFSEPLWMDWYLAGDHIKRKSNV